jgi:hypothetical protein
MRVRSAAFAVFLALGAGPAVAWAEEEDVEIRKLKFAERGKDLIVSGSFTDVFDETLLDELSSGFATTVVLRAYVYEKGTDLPVAFTAVTYRVVYDLWEEVYLIQIDDPAGQRELRRETRADALKDVTTLAELPVAALSNVAIGPHHFLGLIVEVNPVSQELLAEVRRWIARPQGSKDVAGNSSFFGSFVSVFVNPKIAEADRTLKFRSQAFYRVKR